MSTRSTSAPAPMTSTRPGCITGMRGPARAGGGEQVGGHRADGVDGDAGAVDGVGVVGRQLQRERGDRRHRAGQADEARRLARPGTSAATSASAARMSSSARRISLGGRRVAVQVPLGQPHAADVDRPRRPHAVAVAEDELGRAAADVDHQERRPRRRRSRAPAAAASREAVAPRKDSSASSRAGDHVGPLPERGRRTMSSKSCAVGGVPGGAGGHHAHRGRAEVAGGGGVLGEHLPRALDGLRAPAGRWRRRPARAARPPCAAAGRCARRRPGRRRPAGGWSWCRSRSPRPGVTRRPRPAGRTARRPTTPPSRRPRGRRSG